MRKCQVRVALLGLPNVNIEGLLVATGENLKCLLAATAWGSTRLLRQPHDPFQAHRAAARRLLLIALPLPFFDRLGDCWVIRLQEEPRCAKTNAGTLLETGFRREGGGRLSPPRYF
jgi:hypothetical protein